MSRTLVIFCGAAAVLLAGQFSEPIMARPNYKKVFTDLYPHLAAKKVSCAMCHPAGNDKKQKNHYSIALEKELGEKAVKDEQRIREALLKLEEGECRSGNWGKRIKHGLPPCVCRDIEPPQSVIERWLDEAARE